MALVAAIAVVSLLHYLTPISDIWVHPLLQRAYYVPILLMALWFGWRGGIAASALAGVLYIPHIVMAWKSNQEYRAAQYVEIGMFFVIAGLIGAMADLERMQRQRAEETASMLNQTNHQLQSSMEMLRRSDRLSALGQLSASLAHEIRNPLGGLDGAVQILKRPELPTETRKEFAEMASMEVERLNSLLSNFLDFARPQTPRRSASEPELLFQSVANLVNETARMSHVELRIESSGVGQIAVDSEQIRQVLLNLALNAVQAMPEGGELVLRSRQEGDFAILEVVDHGVGIAPENLERIFDPFFTTRASGTGLGLSIAYQIVQGHGGRITARNNLDRGATFAVFLPLANSDPEASQTRKVSA